MTGYGRGDAERGGWRSVVEIRSVNHRYSDVKFRGAPLDPATEERVAAAIRSRIERGALTVAVHLEPENPAAADLQVDLAAARRVYDRLSALAASLGLRPEVSLELVCAQPGVLVAGDVSGSRGGEEVAGCVLQAVDAALGGLIRMRELEGGRLERDVASRLDHLSRVVEQVDSLVAGVPEEARLRLAERVARLLRGTQVELDESRLAQEIAVLAERSDVTEELVRLRSHIAQARSIMAMDGAIGRRLDFLIQEMARELNTVASKSQSADIARKVVEAKAELEKIREQMQNIE